ncbi:hypothetical protein [Aurantiacibacter gilvus]|uniref:Lipoprotein n=1 Tax=Aurantiacibacter gilvus TaxID=3139141 RepID=A0ABU9IIS0_9SPHN
MRTIILGLAAAMLAGCVTTTAPANGGDPALERMLSGESVTQGAELDAALDDASEHPLGSSENPVRASMPEGQRAYLDRLRCADGSTPSYRRVGNFGVGVYGNIVDGYEVTCAGEDPKMVVMDMYHRGHVENRPVPGFTIAK